MRGFANEEELKDILNLTIGSVTPLGLVNDRNNLVTLLIDKELQNCRTYKTQIYFILKL